MRLLVMLAMLCWQSAVSFVAAVSRTHSPAPKAKHLVLLVVDDLGYADLGYTGSAVRTPVLDELATSGVILSVGGPQFSQSRIASCTSVSQVLCACRITTSCGPARQRVLPLRLAGL